VAFLSTLALTVALFVAVPYLAHRLRRQRTEEQPFPPAGLVPPAPEKARRRSRLEDRALLAIRVACVLALALLGATPLVRCSRLSVQRPGGASVAMALVVDDSMSMRADVAGEKGTSRFERARLGALQLLASAREGDAVAIVLAGAPARIDLAATTDLASARSAIETLVAGDRGTDLQGALVLARGLVASLPQVDRRVVVLSDLADGHADEPPPGESGDIPTWIPLPELRADDTDCAVLRADRRGVRVRVAVACGPGKSATGRDVVVEDADGKPLGHAPLPHGSSVEATVLLPAEDATPARARLSGADAVAVDDVAPVVAEANRGAIAIVADAPEETVATGGAPIAEQALASLRLDVDLRPIPALPDRVEDLSGNLGVLLDDPPGLTPEQRHALAAFIERGGLVLVALGPRAAAAPLGASLAPILSHAVAWTPTGGPAASGADVTTALGALAGAGQSLADLGAERRATLAPEDVRAFEALVKWYDGAPLIARRAIGGGEAWIVTLPFSVDASDLPLRPAFLALLDGWVRAARERAAPRRSEVGTTWKFPSTRAVDIKGPLGDFTPSRDDGVLRFTPSLLGPYRITIDGQTETRVASPDERELDLRPRGYASSAGAGGVGHTRAAADVSREVALAVLGLMVVEMALRLWTRRKVARQANA
jgi:hypothetical protein